MADTNIQIAGEQQDTNQTRGVQHAGAATVNAATDEEQRAAQVVATLGADIARLDNEQPNSQNGAEQKDIKAMALASLGDLRRNIPQPKTILSYKGAPIWRLGNLSLVIGGEGSRKTFLLTLLVVAFLQKDEWVGFNSDADEESECDLLWIDTEQSEGDVYEAIRRVNRSRGESEHENMKGFQFACLRPYSEADRLQMTKALIEHFNPRVVVIDGIADLMLDTNDLGETTDIKDWLLKTTAEHKNHIVCVLHTNPNSEKARGHIGSELPRKAETVMLTQAYGDVTKVDFPKCRKKKPETFSFRINEKGLPEICETPQSVKDEQKEAMTIVCAAFNNRADGLGQKDAVDSLFEQINAYNQAHGKENIKRPTAKTRLYRYCEKGYIRQDDITKKYYSCCFKDADGNLILGF